MKLFYFSPIFLSFVFAVSCRSNSETNVHDIKDTDPISGTASSETASSDIEVDASQIIVDDIRTKGRMATTTTSSNTSLVHASRVNVKTEKNHLRNTNLQDVLDKEMAVSLSDFLPGTSWQVENKSSNNAVNGKTGIISFSSPFGEMSLSGLFAPAYIDNAGNLLSQLVGNATISQIGDKVIIFDVNYNNEGSVSHGVRISTIQTINETSMVITGTYNGDSVAFCTKL